MAASIADLQAAIAAQTAEIATAQTALVAALNTVSNDITELIAKLAAAGTPPDLTDELTQINANTQAIATAVTTTQTDVSGLDAQVNPPAPPPA